MPPSAFEYAIQEIEERLGFTNQPRVIVFHEKEGRRHAHCVWSRIEEKTMTAINLPFYKNKLNEIAKDLFLKYEWDLPQGFINRHYSDPTNFTLEEWQQAKCGGEDPKMLKSLIKTNWNNADTGKALQRL